MCSIRWLALAVITVGCASQTRPTERQLNEQEQRLKRLTATCDRLEERVAALETAARGTAPKDSAGANADPQRPDLPTIKVAPDSQLPDANSNAQASPSATDGDKRVVIVGEGSHVEARAEGEVVSSVGARPPGKANSRAPKPNQGSLPQASKSGSPQ